MYLLFASIYRHSERRLCCHLRRALLRRVNCAFRPWVPPPLNFLSRLTHWIRDDAVSLASHAPRHALLTALAGWRVTAGCLLGDWQPLASIQVSFTFTCLHKDRKPPHASFEKTLDAQETFMAWCFKLVCLRALYLRADVPPTHWRGDHILKHIAGQPHMFGEAHVGFLCVSMGGLNDPGDTVTFCIKT